MQNASIFNVFHPLKIFWAELAKMRTAIFLLVAAAVVNLAGTFLTQGLPSEVYLATYGPFWGQLWLSVGLNNILHTVWFLIILILLMASITSCLYMQTGKMLRAFFLPKAAPKMFIGYIKTDPKNIPAHLLPKKPTRTFGKAHYYQKGRHVRIGYLCLHFGILFGAVAALISGLGGWRGTLNLRIDEPDNIVLIFKGDNIKPVFLPFEVTAETFEITRYQNGNPRQYQTHLTISSCNKPLSEPSYWDEIFRLFQTVEAECTSDEYMRTAKAEKTGNFAQKQRLWQGLAAVNRPFRYKGHAFYQSDFGDAGSKIDVKLLPLTDDLIGNSTKGEVYDTLTIGDFKIEIFDGHAQTEDNHGPAVDINLFSPITAGHSVRVYQNRPDFLGLPDGDNAEGEPNFTPLALGVVWDETNLHILQKLLTLPPTVESLKAHANPILEELPAQERLLTAAKILSSLPVLQELNLPALPRLTSIQPTVYTGLQVAYDPGVNLFWLACTLTLIGIFLLLGQAHIEIWVTDKTAYIRSHRGILATRKLLTSP